MNVTMYQWRGILNNLGIKINQRSTGCLYILCPFHKEKTPSFKVWSDSMEFRCFGCHRKGTLEDFFKFHHPDAKETEIESLIRRSCSYNPENPGQILFDYAQTAS